MDFAIKKTRRVAGTGTASIHLIIVVFIFITGGCATHTRIHNRDIDTGKHEIRDDARKAEEFSKIGDIFFALSFSGGGTRAAAFSYGVLSELRDTQINIGGKSIRLLDEVDHISSVSGGSFTSAYYGLFGDRIFEDFESVFLRENVQKILINSILNPSNWFRLLTSGFDRSSLAVEYYDDHIFKGKTFADMEANGGPFIQINATDLGTGQSFGFTQESFSLLCSDLSDFKVARAVAASSAVPIVFPPITLKNYSGCELNELELNSSIEDDFSDIRIKSLIKDLSTFSDKDQRKYIHLVDGGIADNIGVRSMIYRILLLNKLRKQNEFIKAHDIKIPKDFVVIVVNAQTKKTKSMEQSSDSPSASEVVSAVSSAQISRYNLETMSQSKELIENTAMKFSSADNEVNLYFIELQFENIPDKEMRKVFNNMATSFALPDDQVDLLYDSGRKLLKESKEYQRLLQNLALDRH